MTDTLNDTHFIGQLAIGIFVAIVFLQSGIDKIIDWEGNYDWLKTHFEKTFLCSTVRPMLAIVTTVEVIAGLSAIFGVTYLLIYNDGIYIQYSVTIGLLTLLMLIFGQRVAKDYDGAQTIAIYFGVLLMSLLLFS